MWGSLLWALGKRDKGTKEQRDKGIKKNCYSALCLCASVPLSLKLSASADSILLRIISEVFHLLYDGPHFFFHIFCVYRARWVFDDPCF
jgi:hypothetical protein